MREALRAFGPVVAGCGVYQISAYLDLLLASLLATGAVASLGGAQTLYVLPVSLCGRSVAAASRVTEMEDVFVASTASARRT